MTATPWTDALRELVIAAHNAGVPIEQTDAWSVKHAAPYAEGTNKLGAYDAAGEFHVIAHVDAPADLRALAALYPPVRRCAWCGDMLSRTQRRFCSRGCTVRQQNRDRAKH